MDLVPEPVDVDKSFSYMESYSGQASLGDQAKIRGPKDQLNMRILHSGSKTQDTGIPETMVRRTLMLMCFFGPKVARTFPATHKRRDDF